MSGISDIKKKAKLSLDEMYDSQPVGKLDSQKDGIPDIKQTIQPAIHIGNFPDVHPSGNPSVHEPIQPISHKTALPAIHQAGSLENNPDLRQDTQLARQTTIFPNTRQQTHKIPTYKMTFNLTEDIYKSFNDLYAHRMLQGRKTEKSEMICEAIQWLIKMENGLNE